MELPLVIGTIPFSGVGSRISSVSSWSSLPSAPPSYSNIRRDLPRTPLLHAYDEEEGLFMSTPQPCYAPPPGYSQARP